MSLLLLFRPSGTTRPGRSFPGPVPLKRWKKEENRSADEVFKKIQELNRREEEDILALILLDEI